MMRGVWRKIKVLFHRHEAWAATISIEFPFLSIFLVMTIFFLWAMVPTIAVWILIFNTYFSNEWMQDIIRAMQTTPIAILWVIISVPMIIAVPLHLKLFMWFGRWYLVCVTLMFGSHARAHKKLAETQAKLKALTDA